MDGSTVETGARMRATHVDRARVQAVAALLRARYSSEHPSAETWADPVFWNVEADGSDRCQFLAVGNAINFRFWSVLNGEVVPAVGTLEGNEYRGSMYMWRRLRLAIRRGQLSLDAQFLADLTEDQISIAFADDSGVLPLRPGLDDRLQNLRDLGSRLRKYWNGQFVNVVDASAGSLENFAQLSAGFRAFDDPIQKLTMVNAIMLTGSGLASFDREPLPGIDYHLMKQALRQGLVSPPSDVADKLINREFLEPHESLTLRRAVLDALLEVAEQAALSTAVLDNVYWLNKGICRDPIPACETSGAERCLFESACARRTGISMPLESTRYY